MARSRTIKLLLAPLWELQTSRFRRSAPLRIVIYARVSSHKQTTDLDRQVQHLLDYSSAKDYQVARTVKEIGSGLNDHRPKFLAILTDPSITKVVVEQKDRATRFGFHYLEALLEMQGRCFEVVNLAETNREDLLADLTSVIYSMCAKVYGQRRARDQSRNHSQTGGGIMKRVEQHVIKRSHAKFGEIDALAFASKNLWNLANYHVRQSFIFQGKYLNNTALYRLLKQTDA